MNGINATAAVALNPGDILGVGTQQFTLEREDDPLPHRPTVNYSPQWSQSSQANVPVSIGPAPEDPAQVTVGQQLTSGQGPGLSPSAVSLPNVTSADLPAGSPGSPAGLGDAPTHLGVHSSHQDADGPEPSTNNRGSAYRLFWGLSDKVLALGRVEEAERMMGPRLTEMRTRAEASDVPDDNVIQETLRRALKLAVATKKDAWFAWIFDYARLCRYKMPLPLLDEIYAQMFVARPAIGSKIVGYAQTIDDEVIVVRLATLRRLCRE